MAQKPKNKPQKTQEWAVNALNASLKKFSSSAWDGKSLILFGCEGYYLDSMGVKGQNDRGMYDDALFVVSERLFLALNINLDPTSYRPGHGHGSSKGMGTIHYGVHEQAYAIGKHKTIFPALRQVGNIIVRRDADSRVPKEDIITIDEKRYYLEIGNHQVMNFHPGGANTTSSLGCQTIPRDQWRLFIDSVVAEARRMNQKRFTYVKDRIQG